MNQSYKHQAASILFSTLVYGRTLSLLHVVLCHHLVLPCHARQSSLDMLVGGSSLPDHAFLLLIQGMAVRRLQNFC